MRGDDLVLRLAFPCDSLKEGTLVFWEPGFDGEDPTLLLPLDLHGQGASDPGA